VVQKLRALCLAFPEVSESASWGHPNFRAGKRTFATFEIIGGRPSVAFRLDTADVEHLLRQKRFFTTPYGRGQWISVWADGPLNWRLVAKLLDRSYRTVAIKRMIVALDRDRTNKRQSNRTDTRRSH
jgi:predicted DNA-binding protein (MmcQ/YjbR family)